jgi:Flp pilus assembly protein TadG
MRNMMEIRSLSPERRPSLSIRAPHAGLLNYAGQSLLEFALTMPLFILILVGTVELARFAWAAIEVSNAARAGAAYGAQDHTTVDDVPGIKAAAANDAPDLTGLTVIPSKSCTCSTAPTTTLMSCSLSLCPSPAILLDFVHVNTSANVTPLINYPGLPTPFTVQGSAVMEAAQQ